MVMDTQRKITEGNDQVYDTNYYTPLQEQEPDKNQYWLIFK